MSLATPCAMSLMNIRQTELANNYAGATPISVAFDKEGRELSLKIRNLEISKAADGEKY